MAPGGQRFAALLFICGKVESGRKINLVIIQEPVAGLSEAMLTTFARRACRAVRLKGAISVLVTSSRELRSLNRRFRSKNKATDVLSFPAMPGLVPDYAGDIAISAEIAAKNARRLGHSAVDEIKVLTVHGILHLAGYDHERDHGAMERKEKRLRKALGLPSGLIERTSSSENRSKVKKPGARISAKTGTGRRSSRAPR